MSRFILDMLTSGRSVVALATRNQVRRAVDYSQALLFEPDFEGEGNCNLLN
jgi:hypothetical protein